MNVEIRARGIEMTEPLEQVVQRRVYSALRRFGHRVRRASVQLTDLNGPKGGVDIRCKIEAHLEGGGQVIVHQTRETPFTAVADACEAVARAVRRRSDRLRSRRRGA